MTDLIQYASAFSMGAAGCLSMAKLMQLMERRRNAKSKLSKEEHDAEPEKAMSELFPNGERMQVIRAIKDLRRENEERREEYQNLKATVDIIAARLKIPL